MADTLIFFKRPEAAGFTRKQAEAQVEMIRDFSNSNLATGQSLTGLEGRIDLRFTRLESEMARLSDHGGNCSKS